MSPERTSDMVLLVVETTTGDSAEERTLRRAVHNTLGLDDRRRPWYVERLFPATGPETTRLDRYFRVSGSVDAPPQRFEQTAFELAYRLSDTTGFSTQPDLPSSSFAPSESDLTEDLVYERFEDLPGSESHDWALDSIHCHEAWRLKTDPGGATHGQGITIAHPDTGYTDHPDAGGVAAFDLRRDWDVLSGDDNASDPLDTWKARPLVNPGHGTSTAGVLAGRLVTSIQGVAPRATVVPVRTMKSVVQVFDSDVARAVDYARRIGAHVVSMSLGGTGFLGLREAIDLAVADGLIVLAAAGNQVRFVVAPASYPNCIAVAATNANNEPWAGSSRGTKVAVSAPGESVWVATYHFDPSSGPLPALKRHHGTSFAVAHVAGAAALWLAHHGRDALIKRYGKPRLQAAFLHLIATRGHRRPARWDQQNFGVGILNAEDLLSAPLPRPADLDDTVSELVVEAADAVSAGECVATLFPDLTTDEVKKRLATLFGARVDTLSAKLDRYEAELVRVFSERPEAWDAFMAVRVEDTLRAESSHVATVARFGSPSLVRDLRVSLHS